MANVAILPSIAILAGTYAGIAWAGSFAGAAAILAGLWLAAVLAWLQRRNTLATILVTIGYFGAAAIIGSGAAGDALQPSLRDVPVTGEPQFVRARLVEDAAIVESGALLRVEVESVAIEGEARSVSGGVRLFVSGSAAAMRASDWSAGRTITAPVTFRTPARYLNDGVPDFERDLALDSIALTGSVKSALLVDIREHGSIVSEGAARIRGYVRRVVRARIAPRDEVAAAIVIAILIGDRSALPDSVRERLQAAGTYHVIAISGGNIAILAALILGSLSVAGVRGRLAALLVIAVLLAYAGIVNAGPSVWRATLTASVYFVARVIDHRSPPWNAMAVSAALLACAAPLDVRNVGFALTFGATAAILEVMRRLPRTRPTAFSWVVASVAASAAVEVVLLPVTATGFSRATIAGVVLNLLAVPLMTVVQVAGIVLVALGQIDRVGSLAGLVATWGAEGLVNSARLVDVVPWLAARVPPPPLVLTICYYVALVAALAVRRYRPVALIGLVACAAAIVGGRPVQGEAPAGQLRLTVFDVGQGDAILLQLPDGASVMVDAGGAGFDGGGFDIGSRVLAPALWARGVRRLDAFAITHGDPDHIGGGLALVRDFDPSEIWEGIPVPTHAPLQTLLATTTAKAKSTRRLMAGSELTYGPARIRVLNPPSPDWERRRVRNDDSLVMEVIFGDVAILLTGDAGAEVEQQIVHRLTPARLRILKVGHHGSRTSTSKVLVDAWKPQMAIVSCGRANRFGHPAAEVIERLEAAGSRIYRTDKDGQVTVHTDGKKLSVRTLKGDSPWQLNTKNTKNTKNTNDTNDTTGHEDHGSKESTGYR